MKKESYIPFLIFGAGVLLSFTYSFLIDWHNVSVDVGALRYFALRLNWTDLSSYHNGFYPTLPILLVKLIGADAWSFWGTVFSNLLYGYALVLAYHIIRHFVQQLEASLVAAAFIAISPGFFSIFTSAMPDSLMVSLFLSGLYLVLLRQKLFWGGVLLGLAAATRYHGLLLAVLTLVILLKPSKTSLKPFFWHLLGFLLAYSPQMLFTLVATDHLFDNDQLYNVFKTFYRQDIQDAAQLQLPENLLGVIAHKPLVFWTTYARILLSHAMYWAFPLAIALWLYRREKMALRLAVFIGIYVLITSLGGSPRMYAPIAALMGLSFAMAYKNFRFPKLRVMMVLGLFHLLVQDNILDLSVQRQNQRANGLIQEKILEQKPDVVRQDIFSSYYDYTWENIPGLIGYGTQRAWLRHGDAWFAQHYEAPDLQGGFDDFLHYCERNHIRFLILNKSKLGQEIQKGLMQSKRVPILAQIANTRPRMTHRYQIISKQFDEIYLFEVLGD